ncbi:hypothetical protein K438DRAFT_1777432 [Mycena galopus ATCC 62051]|nr:hypothetical protein K438DRAFT_1777432 [Mycena galopus ATCC 62051]
MHKISKRTSLRPCHSEARGEDTKKRRKIRKEGSQRKRLGKKPEERRKNEAGEGKEGDIASDPPLLSEQAFAPQGRTGGPSRCPGYNIFAKSIVSCRKPAPPPPHRLSTTDAHEAQAQISTCLSGTPPSKTSSLHLGRDEELTGPGPSTVLVLVLARPIRCSGAWAWAYN